MDLTFEASLSLPCRRRQDHWSCHIWILHKFSGDSTMYDGTCILVQRWWRQIERKYGESVSINPFCDDTHPEFQFLSFFSSVYDTFVRQAKLFTSRPERHAHSICEPRELVQAGFTSNTRFAHCGPQGARVWSRNTVCFSYTIVAPALRGMGG